MSLVMPDKNPPKQTPSILGVRGSADAEDRARELAGDVAPKAQAGAVTIATDALAVIAQIAAQAWGSDRDRDEALRRINEIALAAWAQIRQR